MFSMKRLGGVLYGVRELISIQTKNLQKSVLRLDMRDEVILEAELGAVREGRYRRMSLQVLELVTTEVEIMEIAAKLPVIVLDMFNKRKSAK